MASYTPREQVCIVLSDLFLDTDVSDSYANILARMEESGLSDSQIKAILINEVAPVVGFNMFSPSGAWTKFDPAWLLARIEALKQKPIERWINQACTYFQARACWQGLMHYRKKRQD